MRAGNKRCNGLVPEPRGTTWPPPWLSASVLPTPAPSTPRLVAAELKLLEPPVAVSPWDLTPELYEKWEERVCIIHYDGRLPWREAEALALADILRHADPPADTVGAGPSPAIDAASNLARMVQATLFAAEKGPYA